MASNVNNAQACGHAQNMMHNLRTQLIKFTDQQKVAKQVALTVELMFLYTKYQTSYKHCPHI